MKRRSIRAATHDYAEQGYYFVTICTQCRVPFFGRIEHDGKMRLSRYGYVARRIWRDGKRIWKNVHLDAFVVMPDHIHAIVCIVGATPRLARIKDAHGVIRATQGVAPTPAARPHGPQRQSVGAYIGSYKSVVTKRLVIMRRSRDSIWQRNYYERIIRNEYELHFMREYIRQNPERWEMKRRGCRGDALRRPKILING